jgi:flagellar export protein FliJ
MAKFAYKFETIKKVKESLEKKVQKELAFIEMDIDRMNTSLKEVFEEKSKSKKEFEKKKNLRVADLQFHENEENLLNLKAQKIINEIIELEHKKDLKIAELEQKTKEFKIMEVLEEKHYEDFLYDQNHIEQKELDEIATKKFVRED